MERGANGAEKRQAEGSEVIEYRPYEDGFLQAEVRIYTRRDGGRTERGRIGTTGTTRAGSRGRSTWGRRTTWRAC
jgi:hypothetical protein